MKKQILLIIFSFLLTSFASAQILYLSTQKNSGGLMIGVEVFSQKTKSSIKPLGYIYRWTLADISLKPQETTNNIFFISLPRLEKFFFLDLWIKKPLAKETYSFINQKLFLAEPQVTILRKTSEKILLPLSGIVKRNDLLTAAVKNFASQKLTYVWEFNGVFVSNEKEIAVRDLKEKSGTIKVKVFDTDFKEKVEDFRVIQIE
jgi:hypothetical protein